MSDPGRYLQRGALQQGGTKSGGVGCDGNRSPHWDPASSIAGHSPCLPALLHSHTPCKACWEEPRILLLWRTLQV